jgi:hypothetical protein
MVKQVLGANMPIPEEFLKDYHEEVIDAHQMINIYQDQEQVEEQTWDGIQDAFQPVRELVSGPTALIKKQEYEELKKAQARILSTVSCLHAKEYWGFFTLAGSEYRAPRWLFVDEKLHVESELPAVCSSLRSMLQEVEPAGWHEEADVFLRKALKVIGRHEKEMLPNKKKRALRQMDTVLRAYLGKEAENTRRKSALLDLLEVVEDRDNRFDQYQFTQKWLEMIKPYFIYKQEESPQKNVVRIHQLNEYLIDNPLSLAQLEKLLESVVVLQPVEERIASCIIGVPR